MPLPGSVHQDGAIPEEKHDNDYEHMCQMCMEQFGVLPTKKRNRMDDSSFAIPEERKFPIQDINHARNALARASGTQYEGRVKAAVHHKYPSLAAPETKHAEIT